MILPISDVTEAIHDASGITRLLVSAAEARPKSRHVDLTTTVQFLVKYTTIVVMSANPDFP